jgi:arginine decarboxylase
MPGHKHTGIGTPRLRQSWGEALFHSDLSEMSGIDYLEAPTNSLVEAQAMAAEAFGADWSYFLVNGSSVGNHAALLSAVRPGDKVILPRASHRSVFAALLLAGAEPVYVQPEFHPATGLPLATPARGIADAIQRRPDAAAVHITSPTYYGFCSDVRAIAQSAHEANLPLLVDEAHGAHFCFHAALPEPALKAGADLAVQSIHKTAGSLYQSSVLHLRQGRLRRETMEHVLGLLQSSSPSSLLLASLDEARSTLATGGRALLDACIELAEDARRRINAIPGLRCYGPELIGQGGVAAYDSTKLLIGVDGLDLSGYQAADWLATARSIEVEFADNRHLLCAVTLADSAGDLATLLEAVQTLAEDHRGSSRKAMESPHWPAPATAVLPLREASFAPSRRLPASQAEGEVCAETVMLYPPGIPLLLPGEIIDRQCIEFLQRSVSAGAKLAGVSDLCLTTIQVVA